MTTKTKRSTKEKPDSLCIAQLRANPPLAMSVPEAALVLAVHTSTAWNLVWKGRLKTRRVGKRRIVRRADLEAFLNN